MPSRPDFAPALLPLACLVLIGAPLLTWWWARQPLPALPTPAVAPAPVEAASEPTGPAVQVALWHRRLWQPLRDPPPPEPPPEPPPPPLQATLFAIATRDGRPTATFDHPQEGLLHIAEGESRSGITVEAIEPTSVRVTWRGRSQVLELGGG